MRCKIALPFEEICREFFQQARRWQGNAHTGRPFRGHEAAHSTPMRNLNAVTRHHAAASALDNYDGRLTAEMMMCRMTASSFVKQACEKAQSEIGTQYLP